MLAGVQQSPVRRGGSRNSMARSLSREASLLSFGASQRTSDGAVKRAKARGPTSATSPNSTASLTSAASTSARSKAMLSWTAAAAPFGPPGATLPRARRCHERPWACRFPQGLQLWPRESPRCRLPESFGAPSRVDETALNAKCPVPLPLSPSPNWRGAASGWTGPGGPRSFR